MLRGEDGSDAGYDHSSSGKCCTHTVTLPNLIIPVVRRGDLGLVVVSPPVALGLHLFHALLSVFPISFSSLLNPPNLYHLTVVSFSLSLSLSLFFSLYLHTCTHTHIHTCTYTDILMSEYIHLSCLLIWSAGCAA